MSWFADLADKAEILLNNIDEKAGAAIKSHTGKVQKFDENGATIFDTALLQKPNKRLPRSPVRKPTNAIDLRSASPPKRNAPPSRFTLNNSKLIECPKDPPTRLRGSPTRKGNVATYLNSCPKNLMQDEFEKEQLYIQEMKKRRFSLPEDIQQLLDNEHLKQRLENSEAENELLKNELDVMNKEDSELLDRLQKTENDLENKISLSNIENNNLTAENNKLKEEIQQLKEKVNNVVSSEITKLQEQNHALEKDLIKLRHINFDLEDKINQLTIQNKTVSTKLESDLRHAQTYIIDLQNDLERSKDENHRVEKEWHAYKLRVKSMLNAKDQEIKAFQDGIKFRDESKFLTEQLENLRLERQELSDEISKTRDECQELRHYIGELENKAHSTERLVTALREALKEERAAKNQADSKYLIVKKELKHIQMESTQIIEGLKKLVQEKERELITLKATPSTLPMNNSALNVADYDDAADMLARDKINQLTDTLVEKQAKIDSLIADKNMLRIQLDKVETKYRTEIEQKTRNSHSVVNVCNDSDARIRSRNRMLSESALSKLSLRIGVFIKRNPLFRILIIFYMVGLHLWVALVLLTYTPEAHSASK